MRLILAAIDVLRDMPEIVELLLNHNAKLLTTNGGEDALHWCVSRS